MKRDKITALIILTIVIGVDFFAAIEFVKMKQPDKLFPAATLSASGKLSDYLPRLRGSNGDSNIFFFDSGKPGGTVLILGGTHPNETAGFISATVMLENVVPIEGNHR